MSQTQINDVDDGDAVLTGEVLRDALDSAADPIVCGLKRSVWIQIAVITTI